jgi:2-keto-3-deoxy-L-rhamnonate aldolase RhmA
MIKYPPRGIRSINPSLIMGMGPEEAAKTLMQADAVSFVMIETPDALSNLNAIAAVPGLDVMLVGSMDITTELGILAQWSHPLYQDALRRVSEAAKMHNKLWGISGLFTRPDIWTDAVQNLGASFIVGSLDLGILNRGAKANVEALRAAELKQATSSTNGH